MTHSEFIKALGGGTEVAKLLSSATGQPIDREAVYKWIELNSVAWKWRGCLIGIARERGVPLPSNFLPGVSDKTPPAKRARR